MKSIQFYKYQGTGNDFILIDNRDGKVKLNAEQITQLCDRRFGIGADGVMLLSFAKEDTVDFNLDFYNPDGSQSFCGNGSRCATAFAKSLGLAGDKTDFMAFDGIHSATIDGEGTVAVKMLDVGAIRPFQDGFFLNTGSPHVVIEVKGLDKFSVVEVGRKIRYSKEFEPGGTNVNFVEAIGDGKYKVRTYERGVENETYSCGTGVTAAAIAMHKKHNLKAGEIGLETLGGELKVRFDAYNYGYRDVHLIGPAKLVFQGEFVW